MASITQQQLKDAECTFGEEDVRIVLREESTLIVTTVRGLVAQLQESNVISKELVAAVDSHLTTFAEWIDDEVASAQDIARRAAAVASDLAVTVEQIKTVLAVLQPAYPLVGEVAVQLSGFIALAQVTVQVFQAVAGQAVVKFADAKRIWEQQRNTANNAAAAANAANNAAAAVNAANNVAAAAPQ